MKRRTKLLLSILAALVLAFAVGESYCRWIKKVPANRDRWLEPYVMTGDFRRPGEHFEDPAAFGYRQRSLQHVYEASSVLKGAVDRGSYLFHDRADRARPNPAAPRKRIFVLGGSVSLGDGAEHEEARWWRLVENDLRAKLGDDRIDVIPAGTRSFVSTQERIELELYVLPLKPDAIVVLDGYNDWAVVNFAARPGDPYNQGILYTRYDSLWFHLFYALSEHSALVRHLLQQNVYGAVDSTIHDIMSDPQRLAAYRDSVVNVYRENVTAMARRCRQESIPCLFFVQPSAAVTRSHATPPPPRSEEAVAIDQMLAAVKGSAELTPPTELHDLTHVLDGHADVYVDPCHPRDPGQRLLADAIGGALLARQSWWHSPAHP
jgi:hypothetical protein